MKRQWTFLLMALSLAATITLASGCGTNVNDEYSGGMTSGNTLTVAMFTSGGSMSGVWDLTPTGIGGTISGSYNNNTLTFTMVGEGNCTETGTGTLNNNTLSMTFSSGTCSGFTPGASANLSKTAGQ